MSRKIIEGSAPGQRPLLEGDPPCDCPAELLTAIQHRMMLPLARQVEEVFGGCPIGVAVTLALMAGNLVNPANVVPEHRANARQSSLIVARTLENIASGIRRRAAD